MPVVDDRMITGLRIGAESVIGYGLADGPCLARGAATWAKHEGPRFFLGEADVRGTGEI